MLKKALLLLLMSIVHKLLIKVRIFAKILVFMLALLFFQRNKCTNHQKFDGNVARNTLLCTL